MVIREVLMSKLNINVVNGKRHYKLHFWRVGQVFIQQNKNYRNVNIEYHRFCKKSWMMTKIYDYLMRIKLVLIKM